MSALPDKPQVTNYEVTAALEVALQTGWVKVTADQEHGVVHHRLSEMEMLQVLEAAFGARSERFNGELRREAQLLQRAAELARIRTQKYKKARDTVLWAQDIRDRLTGLLEAIKDSRALRISNEFRSLEALLEYEPPPADLDDLDR